MRPTIFSLLAVSAVACNNHTDVQCEQSGNCDLIGGGTCVAAASGNMWCAYPDPSCQSGFRFSDQAVGDGLSGKCSSSDVDAGTDARIDARAGSGVDASTVEIITDHQSAILVLGQPNFGTVDVNHGGASARSLYVPGAVSASDNGSLWVFDTGNSRALQWTSAPQSDFAAASRVIGQNDFVTVSQGSATANSVTNDLGALSENGGKVVVSDGNRNRVLIYDHQPVGNGVAANLVFGQPNFFMTKFGTTATAFNVPDGAWTDGVRVVIAEGSNNRVLIWNSFPTVNQQPPDVVLGHQDFTTEFPGNPRSASTLDQPQAVYSDGTRLFVADSGNSRVLIWNSFPQSSGAPADIVVGQPDFVTHQTGVDRNRLGFPTGLAVAAGSLFVVDQTNNRVLVFSPIPTTSYPSAAHVLGQSDFLSNGPGALASGLNVPVQAAVLDHTLYVSDSFNNRVLAFALTF